ncbi:unnamed protein product, partial [Amoebophrya sp. A25]
ITPGGSEQEQQTSCRRLSLASNCSFYRWGAGGFPGQRLGRQRLVAGTNEKAALGPHDDEQTATFFGQPDPGNDNSEEEDDPAFDRIQW